MTVLTLWFSLWQKCLSFWIWIFHFYVFVLTFGTEDATEIIESFFPSFLIPLHPVEIAMKKKDIPKLWHECMKGKEGLVKLEWRKEIWPLLFGLTFPFSSLPPIKKVFIDLIIVCYNESD
jgi:hypothetical protein